MSSDIVHLSPFSGHTAEIVKEGNRRGVCSLGESLKDKSGVGGVSVGGFLGVLFQEGDSWR